MRYLTEAPITQPQPRRRSQESSHQGMYLQPEVLDKSCHGGMTRLGTRDTHGGLTFTPQASGCY